MPKILFLSPEFPPSKLTGAIRPAKFAKYLHKFGWDVTVLTFDHKDESHIGLLNDLDGVRIEKCGIAKKIIVNDLGISYLFQAYRQAIKLSEEIRPDYILVSMPTFMNSLLALYLNRKFGIKYLLDYRDLWVADPYPVRGIKSKAFRLISKVIEPIVLKSAFLSYYVSDAMLRDQMKTYPFLKSINTAVISTGFDIDDIKKIKASAKKNGYIAHIGNADQDMNILDFIDLIKDSNVQQVLLEKNIKLLFVGRKNNFVKVLVDESLLKFFDFKEYVPHNEALQLMADSTGLLILGSNSEQRLNRKVFEYTALNRNVFYLGNKKSPTASVVEESNGVVSDRNLAVKNFLFFLDNISNESVMINPKYSKRNLVEKLLKELM